MATDKQIAANRRNASRPRGPMTEAASANIRDNPRKHGPTAKHIASRGAFLTRSDWNFRGAD